MYGEYVKSDSVLQNSRCWHAMYSSTNKHILAGIILRIFALVKI